MGFRSRLMLPETLPFADAGERRRYFGMGGGGNGMGGVAARVYTNIAVLGDSITEGYDTPDHSTYAYTPLARGVVQRSRASSARPEGVIPSYRTDRYTLAGTWNSSDGGYGPYSIAQQSGSAGATARIVFWGTDFDVYYVTDSGTRAFTIQVDAESPVTVGGSSGSPSYQVANVAAVSGRGPHTVTITAPASGYVVFWGVGGNDGGGTKMHALGRAGMIANGVAVAGTLGAMASLAPDLTIIALTVNDYRNSTDIATYTANLNAAATQAKATGDVAFIIGNAIGETHSPAQTSYNAAIAAVAAAFGAVFVLDIYTRWGTPTAATAAGFLDGDAIHPTAAGHLDMSVAFAAEFAAIETYDFVDTFTRPDNSASIGTPDKGGYAAIIGNAPGIQSYKLYVAADGYSTIRITAPHPFKYFAADYTTPDITAGDFGVLMRWVDDSNYTVLSYSLGRVVISTLKAGVGNGVAIATADQTGIPASGTASFTASAFFGGKAMRCYVNGVYMAEYDFSDDDMAHFGNGAALEFYTHSGNTVDNVKAFY